MSDISTQELNDGNWDQVLVHIKGPLCKDDKEKMVELLCAKLLGQEDFLTLLTNYLGQLLAMESLTGLLRDNLQVLNQVVRQDLAGASTFDQALKVLEVSKKDPIVRLLFSGDIPNGGKVLDQLKEANLSLQGRVEKSATVHDALEQLKDSESNQSLESFCALVECVTKLKFSQGDLAMEGLATNLAEIGKLVCERCEKAMSACNLTSILTDLVEAPVSLADKAEFFQSPAAQSLAFLTDFVQSSAVQFVLRQSQCPHQKIVLKLKYFADAVPCPSVHAPSQCTNSLGCFNVLGAMQLAHPGSNKLRHTSFCVMEAHGP